MKTLLTLATLAFASATFGAEKCPVSGKAVDENVKSRNADDKIVYFCSPKCKA